MRRLPVAILLALLVASEGAIAAATTHAPPPVITKFTVAPTPLPASGGTVTVAVAATGAATCQLTAPWATPETQRFNCTKPIAKRLVVAANTGTPRNVTFTLVAHGTTTSVHAARTVPQAPQIASMTWSAPAVADGGSTITSISCPTTTFCAAVDSNGQVTTFNGTTWADQQAIDLNALTSVSCPTTTFCVTVDGKGNFSMFNGSQWAAIAHMDASSLEGPQFSTVSCPSVSMCVAVGSSGQIAVWSNNAWSISRVLNDTYAIVALACPSSILCEAIDADGDELQMTPSGWTRLGTLTGLDVGWPIASLTCSSTTSCLFVGGEAENKEVGLTATFTNGVWSPVSTFDAASHGLMGEVTCLSTGVCLSVDANGDVEYREYGWWSPPQHVDAAASWKTLSGLTAISCPTATDCVAVGYDGQYLVSSSVTDG